MANTFTATFQSVSGNKRFIAGKATFTDGPGQIDSGMEYVEGIQMCAATAQTLVEEIIINSTNGDFGVNTATSGDTMHVTMWGW